MFREVETVYGIWQSFLLATGIDMKNPLTHVAVLTYLDWDEELYLMFSELFLQIPVFYSATSAHSIYLCGTFYAPHK